MSTSDRIPSLINKIDTNKFGKFLERIIVKLPLSNKNADLFSFDEREKLVQVFELKSTAELASILNWTIAQLDACGFDQSKTERIGAVGGLDTEHIDAFVKVWSVHGRALIERLKSRSIGTHQLIDVNFVLNVDVASEARERMMQPTAHVQLITENGGGGKSEKLNMEFDHAQLVQLYDKLEDVQKQLDSMTG